MFNFFTKPHKKPIEKDDIIFCTNENDDVIINKLLPKCSRVGNYVLYNYDQLHDLFERKNFAKNMKSAKYLVLFLSKQSAYQDIALQYAVNYAKKYDVKVVPYIDGQENCLGNVRGFDSSDLEIDNAIVSVMSSLSKDIEKFCHIPEKFQMDILDKHQKLLISNVLLALFSLRNSNFNVAEDCLKNADKCFEKLETTEQNLTRRAELNEFLSRIYLSKNMPTLALIASEMQIECMNKAGYQFSYNLVGKYATALIENGDIYLQVGEQERAEKAFLSAYKLLEQSSYSQFGNFQKIALIDSKLGDIYFGAKKFNMALECYEKSFHFANESNYIKEIIDVEHIESRVEICKNEIGKKQGKTKEQTQIQLAPEENELCL